MGTSPAEFFPPSIDPPDNLSPVEDIRTDTRDLQAGDLFVARAGVTTDGHRFLKDAANRGAVAAVVDPDRLDNPPDDLPLIGVDSPEEVLTPLLKGFYGDPAESMTLAGITGTNGKTTTVQILASMLESSGQSCAVFGTVGHRFKDLTFQGSRTTPSRTQLYRGLARAREAGAEAAVMEVSSHALDQGRVDGLRFDVAGFTNLSQDHLNYHGSMEEYFQAKAKLFDQAEAGVLRMDEYGRRLVDGTARLGLGENGDYGIRETESELGRIALTLERPTGNSLRLEAPLTGSYNVWNLGLGAALADRLDCSDQVIQQAAKNCHQVPGRCERVPGPPDAIVDYAHTPDALRNVLQGLDPLIQGQLICVFGAGGDRDRTKRPRMARAAQEEADYSVVTSDNPRTEDPEQILDDIVMGFSTDNYHVQPDRGQAIREALELAREEDDLVVVAGKGHETGIQFADIKVPFDDVEVVRDVQETLG